MNTSIRSMFLKLLSGDALYALSQILVFAAIVRLASPKAAGAYALALAVCGPVYGLAGLQLRRLYVVDQSPGRDYTDYVRTRAIWSIVAFFATSTIVLVAPLTDVQRSVTLALAVLKTVEGQLVLDYGRLQRHGNAGAISRIQAGRSVLSILAICTLLYLGFPVWAGVLAMALSTLFCTVVARKFTATPPSVGGHANLSRDLSGIWSAVCGISRIGLPLGAAFLTASLAVNTPRYFLEANAGPVAVAVYSACSYVVMTFTLVSETLVQASIRRLTLLTHSNSRNSSRALQKQLHFVALGLGIACCALALPFGEFLMPLAFGQEFAGYTSVVLLLALASSIQFHVSIRRAIFTVQHRTGLQFTISVVVLAVIACVSVATVAPLGVLGAAIAYLVGQMVQLTCYLALPASGQNKNDGGNDS